MSDVDIRSMGAVYEIVDTATKEVIARPASAREAAAWKQGDVGDLAKHLSGKYGTEHLFSDCMGDETTSSYDEETRAAVCARVHHEAVGKWPTEKEMKEGRAAVPVALPVETKAEKPDRGLLDRFIDWVSGDKEGRRNANTDLDRLQQIHDLSVMNGAACPMIYKEASGRYRWIAISTNSYQDRDGEILSQASLEADISRADEIHLYGPMRWWHMGNPDVETKEAGAGVDIGSCDFRALHGRMLVESGTFANETIAAALKERAADLSVSVGFFHPFTEPDQTGVYHNVHIFERSLLPRGKESNQLTALTVKGELNDMPTLKEKWTEFVGLVGEEAAQSAVTTADQTEKEAQAKGLKFKEEANPAPAADGNAVPKVEEKQDDLAALMAECTAACKACVAACQECVVACKEVVSSVSMGAEEKEKRETGNAAKIAGLEATIKNAEAAIKELQGDLPRGVAAGFRASQSEVTIMNKETLKEQQADPIGTFLNQFGLKL